MYSLNPATKENLERLKEDFKRDRIVNIKDLIQPDQAIALSNFLDSMKDSEWDISICPYQPGVYTFSNSDSEFIRKGIESATQTMHRELSYVFYRRDIHYKECPCPLCQFAAFLCSRETLDFIGRIIGAHLSESISIFASCYKEGCFLTTHTDTGRGKIAFVFNLTKEWKESYGGYFELLHGDWSTRRMAVYPEMNNLTIFSVEGDGVPHRVLPVTGPGKRLAIAGWFI